MPVNSPFGHIALLRLSAIGDVTHVLPVVETLKASFPEKRLTWVVGALEHRLVAGLPGVDLVTFNKKNGWRELRHLRYKLNAVTHGKGYDVLLHMQVSLRANLVGRAIPARRRIGFDKARARDFHRLFINESIPAGNRQHVLDGLMSFALTLGAQKPVYRWPVTLSAADNAYARDVLHALQPQSGRPVVVISPCSSHPARNWSVANYAWLADYLHDHFHAHVLLCGGPSEYEKNTARAIEQACRFRPVNLTGKDTLKQFFALLQRIDLLVSPDSGPAHMASAAGTPVIALHAASNPKRSGPYRFQHLAVDAYDLAARKYRGTPADTLPWGTKLEYPGVMELVTREMVAEKLDLWHRQYNAPEKNNH